MQIARPAADAADEHVSALGDNREVALLADGGADDVVSDAVLVTAADNVLMLRLTRVAEDQMEALAIDHRRRMERGDTEVAMAAVVQHLRSWASTRGLAARLVWCKVIVFGTIVWFGWLARSNLPPPRQRTIHYYLHHPVPPLASRVQSA